MMNKEIVVSRYNENIDWINGVQTDINITIYNKGHQDINIDRTNTKVINVTNIGREGETFLRHIKENYDYLFYNILFIQGNPFAHYKSFLEVANTKLTESIFYISDWIPRVTTYSSPDIVNKANNLLTTMGLNNISNDCTFSAGAQYLINRNLIKRKPNHWWNQLYEHYISDLHDFELYKDSSANPWIFERIWPIIYNDKSTEMPNHLPNDYNKV